MSCNCGCTNPLATVPPIVKFVRESTSSGNGCALKQPFETLTAASFVPQAVAETQTIAVCASSNYIIGTCVLLIDAAGNTQVQRVTGHVGTTQITLTAYTNAYSDTEQVLTAPIYAQPLGICPPDTTSVQECFRLNALTDAAFIMPDSVADEGSAVAVTFTESVSLPLGAQVYIEGAGWMEVTSPPVGDFVECSDTHYFLNLGTAGNEDGGQTVIGGAYLTVGRAPENLFSPTAGAISTGFNLSCGLGTTNTLTGGTSGSSADMVLDWTANCMVTAMTFRDPNAGASVETLEYQASLQYSSDNGSNWTYLIQNSMEATNREGNGNPVTKWILLTAGTYIWRFLSTDMTGTPGAPSPLEPPVYTHLNVAVLAVRATASVS